MLPVMPRNQVVICLPIGLSHTLQAVAVDYNFSCLPLPAFVALFADHRAIQGPLSDCPLSHRCHPPTRQLAEALSPKITRSVLLDTHSTDDKCVIDYVIDFILRTSKQPDQSQSSQLRLRPSSLHTNTATLISQTIILTYR